MRIDKNRLLDPDAILRYLHETSYGCLHQTIVADWSVYDQCLKYAGKSEEERPRPIIRLAAISWGISKRVFGRRIGVRVLSILWGLFALPSVVARCFLLHRKAYARSGTIGAPIALLQTGVANEVRIASWIAKRHSCDVELLRLDESATRSATELKAVPRAIALCLRIAGSTAIELDRIISSNRIPPELFDEMVPTWMTLLARRTPVIVWAHLWATIHLTRRSLTNLYFTMNYAIENAFMLALPTVESAYIEHGFPRRGIPPLACRQFVYGANYADYLRTFDQGLNIEKIGISYFDRREISPTRSIVIASLQDWPNFKFSEVQPLFLAALQLARTLEWRLILRLRHYDSDAFAKALKIEWDDVSSATDESFEQCLLRIRPGLVLTTWSTAILDASAFGIPAVSIVKPSFSDYFIAELEQYSTVLTRKVDLNRSLAPLLVGNSDYAQ